MRWSTLAGAIVGVASLASAAHTLTKLVPTSARLSAIPVACEREIVRIALTNLGDRAGLVRSVGLTLRLDGVPGESAVLAPIGESVPSDKDKVLVEPGKARVIAYAWQIAGAPGAIPVPTVGSHKCTYSMLVDTVDFEGNNRAIPLECSCPSSRVGER